jgi:arylsulfatase A-like enzyme
VVDPGARSAVRLARWLPLSVLVLLFSPIESPPGPISAAEALPAAPSVLAAEREARPNVLIIVTDDQRWDTLEAMPKTQRWFQEGGTTFTNAFATTPLCCPSRATIFTGRYAHNHGVLNNSTTDRLDHASTMHGYLRASGYQTAIAGKLLNGWDLTADPPHFDRWAIFNENILGYSGVPFNVDGTVGTVSGYSTDFVRDQAARFLEWFERRDRRPWLLYVTPFAPHKPFTAAPRHRSTPVPPPSLGPAVTEADLTDKPPFIRDRELAERGARRIRTAQLRALRSVDDLVGRLTKLVHRLGEEYRTLAFFLSDNGLFWGDHGLVDKRLPYAEAVRIPLMMRWDVHVASGVDDPRPVGTVDLAPTVLTAARISPPRLDGRDLLTSSRESMFLEYFFDATRPVPAWTSIWTPDHQYVEYHDLGGGTVFREYYDLAADPWQLTNLLHDGVPSNDPPADRLRRLSEQLERYRRCRGTSGPNPCP